MLRLATLNFSVILELPVEVSFAFRCPADQARFVAARDGEGYK